MKQKRLISLAVSLMLMASLFTPFSALAQNQVTITIPNTRATAGSTVDVEVRIENNPGILGATLTFEFDEGLTLVGATNGDAFSSLSMTKPGNFISPCNFVWDGQELSAEDILNGVILTLQFAISEDAQSGEEYNITASYEEGGIVNNYLNPVNLTIRNGSIEVLDFTYGDLNSDQKINTTDVILLRRHLAGGYDQIIEERAADVNIDQKTNTTDTILIRRYIAGGYGITLPYVQTDCNHALIAFPAKTATEEEEGHIAYWYCSVCGKYFRDEKGTSVITLEETILPRLPKSEYSIQYSCDMVLPNNTTFKETDTYKPTQTKVLQMPKMDKYKFLGWSDKNGRMFGTEIPEGTTGDLVLYANWASHRNRAVPIRQLGSPIISEDSDKGLILFAYEIGRIENIPIFEKQDLHVVNGIISRSTMRTQTSTGKSDAETIGKSIANATTNSSAWTFSKDWSEATEISEEWLEQQSMTREEAEEFCKNNSNTYNMINSSGGSSSTINVDNSSYRISANQAHQESTYNEEQKYTGFNIDGKLSNSTTTSAGINAGIKFPLKVAEASLGGSLGVSNTFAWEIGAGYENNTFTKDISTGTDSWGNSIDLANSKSTTSTAEKTWNSSQGFSASNSTSSSQSVSKAISDLISKKYSQDSTYTTGGSNGESQEFASTNEVSDLYSSSVTYSVEEITTNEVSFESTGNTKGAYRLVHAGMARVFGVVGYDIKNKSYFTYTHSILDDDEYKEYLDYSFEGDFKDYETSILPFEIPVFVNDYVNSRITSSKLEINDNGVVTKYLGDADDEIVLIPSYYTKNNATTGEPELHKIRGIAPELFKNNTNIIGVSLGNFINEIPESTFEGCTSLKEIICPNVVRIGKNAFKGCSSLSEFSIPNEIEMIGQSAFDGLNAIKSNAPTKEIANIIASSNVQNITLNIAKIEANDFSDMTFEIGEIETFKLLGGYKEYKGLSINSNAQNTVISGVTISDCDVVPIEVSSPNVTLERVTAHSDGFALILKADETTLSLEGISNLLSESANSIIGKNIHFVQLNYETYSAINTNANVLVCGAVTNNDSYLAEDGIVYITEEEYINYLTSRKVMFDANGGAVGTEYVMVSYNSLMGELPIASRDYYSFDGWYTTPEKDDDSVEFTSETVMTSLVDMTLYAHWTENAPSAWVLKADMPSDAEVVNTLFKYMLTEYTESGSSSLSGWEKYNTTSAWGPYGNWSGWSTTQRYGSDSRQVEKTTQSRWVDTSYNLHEYHYYAWTTRKNYCYTTQNYANSTGTGTARLNEVWLPYQLPFYKTSSGMNHYGPGPAGHYGTDLYFKADGTAGGLKPFERDTWISQGYTDYWDEWRYRDRSLIYTYHYRRYLNKESVSYPTGSNISNIQEFVQYRAK